MTTPRPCRESATGDAKRREEASLLTLSRQGERVLILLPACRRGRRSCRAPGAGKQAAKPSTARRWTPALGWQRDGADWIHLVDLDAAFGRGSNRELLAEVVGKLDVQVEMSGGIRDDDPYRGAGHRLRRVNLGTARWRTRSGVRGHRRTR